mmetsp:Transcript_2766/g.5038  ORF Transcript_2766/g.5038 Transcript_2766/m.5038 type:complete len:202 (+) Transcript_2766:132-737(+)
MPPKAKLKRKSPSSPSPPQSPKSQKSNSSSAIHHTRSKSVKEDNIDQNRQIAPTKQKVAKTKIQEQDLAASDVTQVSISWTVKLKKKNHAIKYSRIHKICLNGYGQYGVKLSTCCCKDSLAVYVHASGCHYPVHAGGTEIACGDKHITFSSNFVINKMSKKNGTLCLMPWARAEALAVDGKITITAIIKLSIPEGAEPIQV